MSDLISQTHLVLRGAGFDTWPATHQDKSVVGFEDEAVMGFVCIFSDVEHLLAHWQKMERALLSQYAPRFRQAGDKAWNVYTAFLTGGAATSEQRRQVRWIEEDLERTRKISSAGVETADDIAVALAPVLPIAAKAVVGVEPVADRLRRRINLIAPGHGDEILDDLIGADLIADRLGDVA